MQAHAHAIVLDPTFGRIAYVPDLGRDCIRQYIYDSDRGTLKEAGQVPVGPVRAATAALLYQAHTTCHTHHRGHSIVPQLWQS